jgi:thioredoxin-like negative regulator of GroEL
MGSKNSEIFEVTGADFDRTVLQEKKVPVMVDFHAKFDFSCVCLTEDGAGLVKLLLLFSREL